MIKLQVISVLHNTFEGRESIPSPCSFQRIEGTPLDWEEITLGMSTTVDSETTRIYSGTLKIITRDPELLGRFKVNDSVSLVLGEFKTPLSPSHRTATHPGEILQKEFLTTRTVKELSDTSGIPHEQLQRIIDQQEDITVETSEQLARALHTSLGFWIGLQNTYNISKLR